MAGEREIDLKQFCSTDPNRTNIQNPFNIGEWTFATNGHIAARVPKRDGYEPSLVAADRLFETAAMAPLSPLPSIKMPPRKHEDCFNCAGTGLYECPTCLHEDECDECDGVGRIDGDGSYLVWLGAAQIALKYYRIIAGLPNPKIVLPRESNREPIYFTFEGGDGLVIGVHFHKDNSGGKTVLGNAPTLSPTA